MNTCSNSKGHRKLSKSGLKKFRTSLQHFCAIYLELRVISEHDYSVYELACKQLHKEGLLVTEPEYLYTALSEIANCIERTIENQN